MAAPLLCWGCEFFRALTRRHTWSVRENGYFWFGFLWGLPVPAVLLGADLILSGRPLSAACSCIAEHPIHVAFLLHPLLFAVIFGALGTMARDRDVRIQQLVERLDREARTDGLTGLLNHRAFYEALRLEVERARRQESPLACLILDIDHFKEVNDGCGHMAGDEVLEAVASRLQHASRPYDLLARYGGDEISILLPGSGASEARSQAERLRGAVEGHPFFSGDNRVPRRVTVSIGVAVLGVNAVDANRLVQAADRAMYRAKSAGRNCVVCSPECMTQVVDSPRAAAAGPRENRGERI